MKDIIKRIGLVCLALVVLLTFVFGTFSSVFALEALSEIKEGSAPITPAVQTTSDGFEFVIKDDGTAELVGYVGALSEIVLPQTVNENVAVTSIVDGAFKEKTAITAITVANSITAVGNNAFEGCAALVSIELGKGVKSMGTDVFLGCDSLVAIGVLSENESFSSLNGVLLSRDKKTLIYYPHGNSRNSYSVPNGVEKISDGAFSQCTNLSIVMLPSGLSEIGNRAFLGCENITELILPNSLEKIGNYAFASLKKLTNINIPDSITIIPEAVFSECDALKSMHLGKNTKKIGANAFSYCTALEEIVLPEGIVEVSEGAFLKCKAVIELTLPKSLVKIPQNTFSTCTNLKTVNYSGSESEFLSLNLDTQNAMVVYNYKYGNDSIIESETQSGPSVSDTSSVSSKENEVRDESNSEQTSSKPTSSDSIQSISSTPQKKEEDEGYDFKLFENEFLKLRANKSTFPNNTQISANEVFEGVPYVRVKAAIKELVVKFKVYSIDAQADGKSLQPNGKMLAEFKIPEGYDSKRIIVYHISENAAADKVKCKVDRKNGVVKAEISKTGTYAVAEKPKPKITASGIALIAAFVLAAAILPIYFVKKKNRE